MFGWIDYTDRIISRKFQMMEVPVLHEILHFGAWFCNRWQGFLQIPIVFIWTYFDTPAVFKQY